VTCLGTLSVFLYHPELFLPLYVLLPASTTDRMGSAGFKTSSKPRGAPHYRKNDLKEGGFFFFWTSPPFPLTPPVFYQASEKLPARASPLYLDDLVWKYPLEDPRRPLPGPPASLSLCPLASFSKGALLRASGASFRPLLLATPPSSIALSFTFLMTGSCRTDFQFDPLLVLLPSVFFFA